MLMRTEGSLEANSAWKMDTEIMAETNCTGPCTYYQYETILDTEVTSSIPENWIFPNDTVAAVMLFFVDSATYVNEEFWSYDGISMFGEVGGAIGVFLGLSLSNIYQTCLDILWKSRKRTAKIDLAWQRNLNLRNIVFS